MTVFCTSLRLSDSLDVWTLHNSVIKKNDGSNHFLEQTEGGRHLHPYGGALDLKFCPPMSRTFPARGSISSSQSNCTTAQPHALHLPAFPRRAPFVATWPLKPSAGMFQLLCFSDSHLFMQKSPVPLAVSERMRYNTSLPFPLL